MHMALRGWVDDNHGHLSLNSNFSRSLFLEASERRSDKSSVVWPKTLQMKDDLGLLHFAFLEAWSLFSPQTDGFPAEFVMLWLIEWRSGLPQRRRAGHWRHPVALKDTSDSLTFSVMQWKPRKSDRRRRSRVAGNITWGINWGDAPVELAWLIFGFEEFNAAYL